MVACHFGIFASNKLPLAPSDPRLCHGSAPRPACWRTGEHTAEMSRPLETTSAPTDPEAEYKCTSEPARDRKKRVMELGPNARPWNQKQNKWSLFEATQCWTSCYAEKANRCDALGREERKAGWR